MRQDLYEQKVCFNEQLDNAHAGLWEAYEMAACIRDMCKDAPSGEERVLTTDGMRGLAHIMDTIADKAIKAIGTVPWSECKRETHNPVEGDHE